MGSAACEIIRRQVHRAKRVEILSAQSSKLVQELRQRLAFAVALLCPAIKLVEGTVFTMLKNDSCPHHPVGALAVDQVADDIEHAPSVLAFILRRPPRRQITQQRVQGSRGALKQGQSV